VEGIDYKDHIQDFYSSIV